jgi:predicted phage tail protein
MMLVLLYGELGRRFGRVHRIDIRTPAEAVRALCANHKGFRAHLVEHSEPGYRVLASGQAVGADALHDPAGAGTIRIVPVVAGAGKGGLGQILLGVALIGLSFIPGLQAPLFSIGTFDISIASIAGSIGRSLLFSGISSMLFEPPKPQSVDKPNNLPSYAFDGAVNTAAQGNCVPIAYGLVEVGSQVVSAGLSASPI